MPLNAFSQPPRVALARPNLKFNHRLHATRGIGCELCHGSAAAEAMVTRVDLPMMSSCLGCHDGKQSTARCGACHLTEPDGRLQVKLRHAGDHRGRRDRAARAVRARCAASTRTT